MKRNEKWLMRDVEVFQNHLWKTCNQNVVIKLEVSFHPSLKMFKVILLVSSFLLTAGGEDVTSSLNSNDVTTSAIPEVTKTKTSTENGASKPVTTTTDKVVPSSKASSSTKALPFPTSNPPKLNSTTTPASGMAGSSKGKRTLTESHFPIPFISFLVISLTGVILFFVYKRATDVRWR